MLSGGLARPVTVVGGGTEIVSAGGTDLGAMVSGGTQLDYGLASGGTVFAGSQIVQSGGIASGTTLSGGIELVNARGVDVGTWISGGTQQVFGLASGATIVRGAQVVAAGGTAVGTVINSGGTLEVLRGAAANGFTINSGGVLEVGSGETVFGIAFGGGAIVELASGGTATSTTVASGGTLAVLGGLAKPVTIASGGVDIVSPDGRDFGALISGGTQLVYGLAGGATIFTGEQMIELGGIASRTVVSSGGTLDVLSGGTAVVPLLFAGGTLTLNGTLSGFDPAAAGH